jgi:hypothetical protein
MAAHEFVAHVKSGKKEVPFASDFPGFFVA